MTSLGINLPGFEANDEDADRRIGWRHILPDDALLDWCAEHFTHVRLALSARWMLPRAGDAPLAGLEPQNADALEDCLNRIRQRGLLTLLNIHNFGWTPWGPLLENTTPYYGFVHLLMQRYHKLIWGLGLMNEPYTVPADRLCEIMQTAANVVSAVDKSVYAVVPQPGYSPAAAGLSMAAVTTAYLKPYDEVHAYGDADGSGTYQQPYDQDGVTEDLLVNRLRPAFEAAKVQKRRPPLVGEIGVPGDDPRYVEMLRRALVYVRKQKGLAFVWQSGMFAADRLTIRPASSWEASRGDALLAMIKTL